MSTFANTPNGANHDRAKIPQIGGTGHRATDHEIFRYEQLISAHPQWQGIPQLVSDLSSWNNFHRLSDLVASLVVMIPDYFDIFMKRLEPIPRGYFEAAYIRGREPADAINDAEERERVEARNVDRTETSRSHQRANRTREILFTSMGTLGNELFTELSKVFPDVKMSHNKVGCFPYSVPHGCGSNTVDEVLGWAIGEFEETHPNSKILAIHVKDQWLLDPRQHVDSSEIIQTLPIVADQDRFAILYPRK